jgi:membrane-associated phospholipid phosphatase
LVPSPGLAPQRPLIPIDDRRVRGYTPLDLLTGAYLGLTVLLLLFGWRRIPSGGSLLLVHFGIFLSVLLLAALPRRGHPLLTFLRDTYPFWGLPLFYEDVGRLHRILHAGLHDATVLRWEHALFGLFPSVWLRAWIPIDLLDSTLHVCYLTYLTLVPIFGLRLYFRGREGVCRVFATTLLLTLLTCFLLFLSFPVAGPHFAFIQDGSGFGPFSRFIHRILAEGPGRGTAFPSSPVAASLVVFWMTCRHQRSWIPWTGILSAATFFGVVYCGLHYGVDVLAGLVIGAVCSILGPRLHRALSRWTTVPTPGNRVSARWDRWAGRFHRG